MKVKEGYITQEKAEEVQKQVKLDLNEIVKGREKSELQTRAINDIKTL